MKKYILALDEGTTSARAILFDRNLEVVSVSQQEIPQIYPEPGWVEQNPLEIYASQYAVLTECIAKSGILPEEIAGIGITNQRETVVVWDKFTGKPIYNAIVWQCRRTSSVCQKLIDDGYEQFIKDTTGLKVDPYFSGTKIKWILDNVSGARKMAENNQLMAGTIDTWLLWKLTDGKVFVTDRTNASRTMLVNIQTGEWDNRMLDILSIPRSMLPEIKSSSEIYGYIDCMGEKIPVSGICGDQQSALFGQMCFERGEAKNTYGTGCFLLAHTGNQPVKSSHNLLTTICATEKGKPLEYALEGSVFAGGAVIKWLRDELRLISDAGDSEYFASKVKDNGGVYLVPAFTGLGAPYWSSEARGTIFGLTHGVKRAHIIRSALESIAFQTEDVLSCMKSDMKSVYNDCTINCLKADGGASANNMLMQLQADFSAVPVCRNKNTEATATGVACLAGLGVGFFKDREEIKKLLRSGRVFYPEMDGTVRNKLFENWHRAVSCCIQFSERNN